MAALPSRLCSSLLLPLARSVLQHFLLVLSRGRLRQLLPLLRSSCTRPLKTKKKQGPYNKPNRRRSGLKEAVRFVYFFASFDLRPVHACCVLVLRRSAAAPCLAACVGGPRRSPVVAFAAELPVAHAAPRSAAAAASPPLRPAKSQQQQKHPSLHSRYPSPLPPRPGAASVSFSRPVLRAGPCPRTSSKGRCRSSCGSAAGCCCRRGTGGHGSRRACCCCCFCCCCFCCCCCCRCCPCRETNFGHFRRRASCRCCCFCFCRWFCCPWRRRRAECATPRGRGIGGTKQRNQNKHCRKTKKKTQGGHRLVPGELRGATRWEPCRLAAGTPALLLSASLRFAFRRRATPQATTIKTKKSLTTTTAATSATATAR